MLEKMQKKINIFFKTVGQLIPVKAVIGDTLLKTAHSNKILLEGACEGNLACSTCHVILEKGMFNKLNISERENDLLDLAYGLCETSRLGCQVVVEEKMKNKIIEIPKFTRNLAIDGYKPSIH